MAQPASKLMARDVWQRLPDELLEQVVTKLPLPSLLQMRCVSKSWSSFILSDDFITHWSGSGGGIGSHFLVVAVLVGGGTGKVAAFNPATSKWELLDFDFVVAAGATEEHYPAPVAAAGGLICFASPCGRVAVCNPLTRAYRFLPPIDPPSAPLPLLSGMAGGRDGGYKILLAGPNGIGDRRTFLLDSGDEVAPWRRQADLPVGVFNFETDAVAHAGSFFAIACFPYRLLEFSVERGEWSKEAMALPAGVASPQLVALDGCALLLAGLSGEAGGGATIRVWRLAAPRWEAVEAMPAELCGGIVRGAGDCADSYRCVGHGGMLYFVSFDGAYMCSLDVHSRCWQPVASFGGAAASSFVSAVFIVEPALCAQV